MRHEPCKWAEIKHDDQESRRAAQDRMDLRSSCKSAWICEHEKELEGAMQVARASLNAKRPLLSARGRWDDKVKALHPSVFPKLARCAGTRHWSVQELRQVRTFQLRCKRRSAHRWPKGSEENPTYAHRMARWAESFAVQQHGRSDCQHLVAMGRPFEDIGESRLCCVATSWRDAWWRDTLQGLL